MSTIIKHKEFPKFKSWTMDLCGRPLTIEVGKVAELASASAMVKYGETTVMVAVPLRSWPSPCPPAPGTGWTSSPCPWTLRRSCTPWAASPAPSCAGRAVPLCPPCWPAA